jgi:hypothetical protein
MARDLSASPWRSAAIAPLLTPLAMLMLAVLEAVAEQKPLGPTGDIAENAQMCALTSRWSARVKDRVLTGCAGARCAQLSR